MGVVDATDGRELSTYDDYILSHNAPRAQKQTTLSTTHTRNGPVAPQYICISIAEVVIANEDVPKLIVRMKGEEAKLRRENGLGLDVRLFTKGTGRDRKAGGAGGNTRKRGGGRSSTGTGSGDPENQGFTGECFYCKKQGHDRRECRTRITDKARGKRGPKGVDMAAQALHPRTNCG